MSKFPVAIYSTLECLFSSIICNLILCFVTYCSHLITVAAGILPSDVLVSSPIFQGDDDGGMGASMGGGSTSNDFAEYGGVDPTMDPDLALV